MGLTNKQRQYKAQLQNPVLGTPVGVLGEKEHRILINVLRQMREEVATSRATIGKLQSKIAEYDRRTIRLGQFLQKEMPEMFKELADDTED